MTKQSLHQTSDTSSDASSFSPRVIGIVASAGGLKPLQQIVAGIPAGSGAVYIVLQHLSADQECLLASLLAQEASIPVRIIEDGELLLPDIIYIGPPGHKVSLQEGRGCLETLTESLQVSQLFDCFLISLAKEMKERGAAVILSGAGDDGKNGAFIIKQAGGLVLVQDPDTAEFRSMPEHVINTCAPDRVLAPEHIASLLVNLDKPVDKEKCLVAGSPEYQNILALLLKASHVDFTHYKPATVLRRIRRRMQLCQMHNQLEQYQALLADSEQEREALIRDLLICVTSFFRDPEAFELLADRLLPALMNSCDKDEFRVWVAGCATGEEAYTLAMLCLECRRKLGLTLEVKVLASDISEDSIRRADQGVYDISIEQQVPSQLLDRYFTRYEQGYRVNNLLREQIMFFHHDLTEDVPFSNIDMLVCRNVFIYLNTDIQQHVMRTFGFSLRMGGLLMLSPSESLGGQKGHFELLDDRWRLYRLISKPRFTHSQIPVWRRRQESNSNIGRLSAPMQSSSDEAVRERLLKLFSGRFVPLVLVLNHQGEVVYILGDSSGILHFPSGELVNDLSVLSDAALRLPLMAGLRKLAEQDDDIFFPKVPLIRQDKELLVDVRLCHLPGSSKQNSLVAVMFEVIENSLFESDKPAAVQGNGVDQLTQARLTELEEELYFTKQSLRNAVEELESANEELQSANEEMQSGNEELQSTNEELQSTNEELITVNAEYKEKVRELSSLNDDIANLMLSADVMTVFVDEARRIRQVSPGAGRVLHLIAQDMGRPIGHIAHQLLGVDLQQLVEEVLTDKERVEVEATTADGRFFAVRANPFLTSDGELSGVTLNFFDISNIRKAEAETLRLATVVTHSVDAIIIQDLDGHITDWNQEAADRYGWTEEEALKMNIRQLIPQQSLEDELQVLRSIAAGETVRAFESQRLTKVGKVLDVWLTFTGLLDEQGRRIAIASTEQDVTKQKRMEDEIRLAAVAFETIDGIVVTGPDARILRVNKAFTKITGYEENEVLGQTPAVLQSGRQDKVFYQNMWKQLQSKGSWSGEIWNKSKAGRVYPEWLSINAVRDNNGEISKFIGVFRDIGEKKAHEAEIHKLAFYDILTGLPNRRLLFDRMSQAIARAERSKYCGSIMFLDLDRFKKINDSLGHFVGDELLKAVSERLIGSVRSEDTVARLGGDEFVVLVHDIGRSKRDAVAYTEKLARQLMNILDAPFLVEEHQLHTSCSIGSTIFGWNGDTPEDLLRQADNAMYLAKKMGRNTMRFFDPAMQASADAWLDTERALRNAIKEQEFELFFQPQVDIKRGCVAAEALIRWQRPGFGMIAPNDFIPVLEETGIIQDVGYWVLVEACLKMAHWKNSGSASLDRIAVNISPFQFKHESFVDSVIAALEASGLDPSMLELEVTENLLLDDIEKVTEKMQQLKKWGIRFSIDDFGTGYSSLAYIKQLPIDQIKIDQGFVRDMLTDKEDACIVESIIAMAAKMGLDVIAEGVENKAQEDFLLKCGCTAYQGYLYSKPLSADEFLSQLDSL
ncbi:EAL domain-containing protein [Motiliproteus sp. MSK22-1]|uniref:EAL domain-containing protein n=1 Tax=Motiliproteus sp. MSK22-1 TaxID=1897630 RepID=UPI0009785A81|nr:EAL domain-containing protein [Motiliproteus sp. MSK22-1]OMH32133.1 hypothetical protein BGP75_15660 [Motiliproteus sp. MSK22-1]